MEWVLCILIAAIAAIVIVLCKNGIQITHIYKQELTPVSPDEAIQQKKDREKAEKFYAEQQRVVAEVVNEINKAMGVIDDDNKTSTNT